MDARVEPVQGSLRLLPELAKAVSDWFPELEGRAIPVSDYDLTKLNVPTLPLAVVALRRSTGDQSARNFQPRFTISDHVMIQFWLHPQRFKRKDGSESPFWTYYDYEGMRNILVQNLSRWKAPRDEHFAYRALNIGADEFAVTLIFDFLVTSEFCQPFNDTGEAFLIGFDLCSPKGCCPEECTEFKLENETCDPCL